MYSTSIFNGTHCLSGLVVFFNTLKYPPECQYARQMVGLCACVSVHLSVYKHRIITWK